MAKYLALTLLMVALVLCSSLSTHAARPDQTFASVKPFYSGNVEPKEQVQAAENEEEGCDDKMKELEECLLRRTLVAHTDYIYTQDKNN